MSDKKSYKELSQELDEVLDTLQTAEIDIDTAVTKYEQGMKLIAELENYLKQAENKITKVQQKFDKQ